VPVSATVSRIQSSSVVRGSIRSSWSLPLMRSVIGTAPSMFGPGPAEAEALSSEALFASAGTYVASILAATLVPVVRRNLRRVGSGGHDCVSSSDIEPPLERKCLLKFHVSYNALCSTVEQILNLLGSHLMNETTILFRQVAAG